jgi:hypothetical protein
MLRIVERDRQTLARWWFGFTALAVFSGVVVNGLVAYRADNGFFSPGIARFFNSFAFFTIQSNILVGLSCYLLFRDHVRESTWFRALRLSGLVGITITGIVYHWLLAGLHELRGLALVGDLIVHSVVPLIAVLGFFLFGPRDTFSIQTAKLSMLFLAWWGTFTLVRGEIVGWYPYPFIDVIDKGYPRVLINGVGIALLYALVAVVFVVIDELLPEAERDFEPVAAA